MITVTISARLRVFLRETLDKVTYSAVSEHHYQRCFGVVDPHGDWQISDILELSEMAHRLEALASTLETTNPLKFELVRLSKAFMEDFTAVYDVAMERLSPQNAPDAGMLKG